MSVCVDADDDNSCDYTRQLYLDKYEVYLGKLAFVPVISKLYLGKISEGFIHAGNLWIDFPVEYVADHQYCFS